MALKIHVETQETTARVALDGRLDTVTAPELEQAMEAQLSPEVDTLILDLKDLSFVSSAGLRIFAKLRKLMKSREGNIYFASLQPQVKKVLDIVKAVPLNAVFASIEELDNYLENMQNSAS